MIDIKAKHATKILTPLQIKEADTYTISHEPISSIDLMERAAGKCVDWICRHFDKKNEFKVFCGLGNNGGDGLAITRLLKTKGYQACSYIVRHSDKTSADFEMNAQHLMKMDVQAVKNIRSSDDFPFIRTTDIVVDALFGIGLSKPLEGLAAECVSYLNQSMATVVSIDMPSGLFADKHTPADTTIVEATRTLSFQCPKLAFMFPENARWVGEWTILDIGLSEYFLEKLQADTFYINHAYINPLVKPRKKFSHKGNYGHALLIAGKYGSMGAAVLAAKACLKSGVGLLTVHVPVRGVEVMQITCPEAMVSIDMNETHFSSIENSSRYTAWGIGPGLGTASDTAKALETIFNQQPVPMVLDADALNIISQHNDWLGLLPAQTILTPHPKEFERLAGKSENDFDRHLKQRDFSKKHRVFVLLKGAHSCLTTPEGMAYFNSTGNAGMAKGGSGDALTGIILALLAQGYSALEASLLGMYVHGLAGDLACEKMGATSMSASDLIESLPKAYMSISMQQ
jgi:ADP-dependent NAD(P)H-hydrate dehydratase / NAD(P)H-hydrate epimerase